MGCEECGFYWNHPDEDKPCPLCEAKQLRERVRELEEGIKLHKDLMEQDEHEIYAADEELWQLIDKQEGVGDGEISAKADGD